nr:hypothetical protein Itr_chr02CG10800 [Ipomoea trifida]
MHLLHKLVKEGNENLRFLKVETLMKHPMWLGAMRMKKLQLQPCKSLLLCLMYLMMKLLNRSHLFLPIQEDVANSIQIELIDHELLKGNREQFLDEDQMEREELFALSWLGATEITDTLLLSTIAQVYSNKIQVKLAGSKEKLPAIEDNFQAFSFVDFEEIDQANFHEGIQRSLMDFQHHLGATSSAQPKSVPMWGKVKVTIPEDSNMQVVEPVANHIVAMAHEDMLEEPVMIPGLGRIPFLVERIVMETEEVTIGGCEINKIPAEIEVEELAMDLATVPIEVTAEIPIIATVHDDENQVENMAKESKEVTAIVPHSKVQAQEADKQRADNFTAKQNRELLNVIHQQQNQIIGLQNELSALRKENVAASTRVDKIYAKVDKIDGNVEFLIDYAKKGGESSHLALSHSFASTGRGRGRGRSSGVSGFS